MPRRRSHTRRARLGEVVHVGVEHDEEVVAEAVVLGQGQRARHARSASTTAGATSATGSRSMSYQRMRGSRRNHRSWRTANWRVRRTIVSTASSRPTRAVEVLEQFLVPEGLGGGPRHPARAGGEALDLGQQPGRHHPLHPLLDPRRQHRSGPPQAEQRDGGGRERAHARPVGAERAAAADRDLERPLDAAAVAGLDAVGGDGVERPQAIEQDVDVGLLLEVGAGVGVLARQVEVVEHGRQVEPGAGDEQRPAAAPGDRPLGLGVGGAVVGDGERLVGVDEIEAVVGHGGPVGGRRLGRADVHAPVDLHGVDGHDLGAGDLRRRRHRHVRLPRRRRPHDDHRRRRSPTRVFRATRVLGAGMPRTKHPGGSGHRAATGMRRRCDGSARCSTSRPVRWCGAAPVISTRA